ncbi:MAG: FAD-binding oxidoreductase [Candidatus Thorarchaeota archaeon]
MSLLNRLSEIVGPNHVSDGPAERYVYSFDMTENEPCRPAAVVMPVTVAEIQRILRLANAERVPVVPFITGQNVGGLTIPQVEGAIVIDLKRMNRILDVDEEAMYAVIEPGVTFGHMKRYLDLHHPGLRYTYPLAPPFTSVMANALLQGLCDLSTRHGAMANFINGIEAVLPTGEVVRAGSCIMGDDNWFGRFPLPDLIGLFSGWQGMTGIVTKMAVQLWPKPRHVRYAALFTVGEHDTTALLKRLVRTQVLDDADCMSISLVKMLLGVPPPVEVFPDEPQYATLLTVSGNTEREVDAKFNVIETIVDKEHFSEPRVNLIPWDAVSVLMGRQADSWVDFPSDAFKILTQHDGLTWVGTYIHPARWGGALEGGRRIVEKYGFELMAFLKPMNGMHYGECKFIIRFPKDPNVVDRVRKCNSELLDFALDVKAIPYKTPVWAAQRLLSKCHPGFVELLRRVKKVLDPNGIMNPGRYSL